MTLAARPLATTALAGSNRRSVVSSGTPGGTIALRSRSALAGGPLAVGFKLPLSVAAANSGRVAGKLSQRIAAVGRTGDSAVARLPLRHTATLRQSGSVTARVRASLRQGMRAGGSPLHAAAIHAGLAQRISAFSNLVRSAAVRVSLAQGLRASASSVIPGAVRARLLLEITTAGAPTGTASAQLTIGRSLQLWAGPAETPPSPRAFHYRPSPRVRRMAEDGRLERVTGRITQDPAALLDYELEFIDALAPGETLVSHSVTATQGSITLLTRDSSRVTAWFTGGTSGTTVALRYSATSSGGRTFVATLRVNIGPDVVSTN